jgi:hypothetical protein
MKKANAANEADTNAAIRREIMGHPSMQGRL